MHLFKCWGKPEREADTMGTAIRESEWREEEKYLAEHWEEMTIRNPAVPVGGVWKDGMYICIYCDMMPSGSIATHD